MYSRPRLLLSLIGLTIFVLVVSLIFVSVSAQSPGADHSFPGTTNSPTVKSQMWINDGTWWGVFSDSSSGLFVYKKVGNDFIKGNLVDPNVLGLPDTLWDGTNLFVLVLENPTQAKLYKYGYTAQQYDLAPGFPVTLPLTGLAVSAVISKDSSGKLWVAYAGSGSGTGADRSIHVIWSTSADHLTWDATGSVLESGTATNATEVAAIVAFNDGAPKVGVLWSNQALGQYAFRYHLDGALETNWSAKEVVDTNGIAGSGGIASEYASIQAAPDGRVLAVGLDQIGNGHAYLYVRSTSGTWAPRVPVNTVASSQPSRPILLLDTENNFAYCLYRDSGSNKSTLYSRSNLNNPSSFEAPHVLISAKASEGTSTKQHLNSSTDLIAAASQNGEILWNILDLSGPPTASFQANPISGNAPLTVSFTDTSTDDSGIVSRSWNFGDGYNSTEANPTHVFRAGTWNVSLQVTDAGANTSTANQSIAAADVGNPVIQALTPATVNKNTISSNFTLTVDGGGFLNGAVVRFNGNARTTSFVSATRLTATITLADVATAGVFPITVALPSSAVSSAMDFTVTGDNPAPIISTISPITVASGSPAFNLTVNGSGFVSTSKVWVNGTERVTTFVSQTQLTTNIADTDLVTPLYQIPVWVVNAPPGGGTSNTAYFDITPVCSTPATPLSFQAITEHNSVQSQLWHNDGSWWAAISDSSTGLYFWRQVNNQFVKGAQIAPNSLAAPDTLWNGTDLFILSYETSSQAKFYKYSYDSLSKTYTLLGGFPVNIPLTGLASSLTFTQDSTGKLWATYTGTNNNDGVGDGKVHVIWTTSADHLMWDTSGVVLETNLSVLLTETSAITAFGGNKIAVTWSNQASNETGFRYHLDADPESNWSVKEIVDSGVSHASEYMNLKGLPDGRVFLAQADNIGNRHVNLFRRNASGTWDPKIPVTRDPLSKPKSPLLWFDETNSEIYVGYRDSGRSSFIYAPHMNSDSSVMPAGCSILSSGVSNPTGTKQSIDGLTDLAVAAHGSNELLAIFDLPSPPPPTISAILPDFKTAGDPDFILTVDGTNFKSNSVVRIDGTSRPTTFVSSVQLTAQITAADIAAGGLLPITVGTPGAMDSNAVILSVDNPPPTLTSISPVSLPAGGPAFDLTAMGTNFNSGTQIRFNGVNHGVIFVSNTEVHAQIAASEIASPGVFLVEIANLPPGGGVSSFQNFTVQNAPPTLTSLTPSITTGGGAGLTLTVDGTNFNGTSVVLWNGSNRVTTFVNPTRLTAQLTAGDIQNGGVFPVAVSNPGVGGGTSSVLNFTVNNPLPQMTTIAPSTAAAGGASFTLTINGAGFVPGSVVRFNGSLPANERTAVFVSGTQLTATINAADIAVAGTFPITVFNSTPGGGLSAAVNLTVSNPAPTITSISPATVTPGVVSFPLTVTGSNFNANSLVRINGVDRASTLVSSTQLTTQISASEVATAGTISVTVFNPAPGGGLSSVIQLLINNPLPTIASILPTNKTAGDAAFTLTVEGTNFISTSVVRFNNSDRVTTRVSGTQLQAQLTAADVAVATSANITVFNPAPGGGVSAAATFTVNNPTPVVSGILPANAVAGGGAYTLTVNGSGFVNSSIVRFNDNNRATTFVSATQLTISVTAADIAIAGTANISVFSPAPGGGTSSSVLLTINNSTPSLSSISPTSKPVGAAAFVLTLNGTNFNNTMVVRFNGSDRPTTLISPTQLNAQIGAADLASAGTYPITVVAPAPGGGTSSAINLTVNNPLPTIANISPTSALQGSPAFLLTINGSGFLSGSVVSWNGQSRATNFISSTQLSAQITGADLNVAATANVTVNNAAPGGGTSNLGSFTITSNPRLISVPNSAGTSGGAVTLAIQLTAQGDENALGFSLVYDTALLSNPTASLGSDAAAASLNANTSQVAQGHFGVALSLPSGMSFTAGTRQIVLVTFTLGGVAPGTQTQISFGDQPITREVANASADVLPTAFIPGTLTVSTGFEADVAPRPNGSNNGTVSVADWVQIGRFASGVDVAPAGGEFQRTDCAPRTSLGNGAITVSDWVQAGRYAAGLDPVSASGGPSAPSTSVPLVIKDDSAERASINKEPSLARTVRLKGGFQTSGPERILSVELEALGSENALGFSLIFDPEQFQFRSAEKGSDAQLATMNLNLANASKGRLGIAVALPGGRSFSAGTFQVVVLKFDVLKQTRQAMAVAFADLPVARELVAVDASGLKATFDAMASPGVNAIDNAQYFVYQHYLDILGRLPDAEGLDYWTNQIEQCGSDQLCVQNRRVVVSNAFFFEPEFQNTGGYLYRVYKSAFGTPPTYAQFLADRSQVIGGPLLNQHKTELTTSFVQRPAFTLAYPLTLTPQQYVAALDTNTGNSLTQEERDVLVAGLVNGTDSRATVLRKVAESQNFIDREYNSTFVLMQYFGYLRRDPEAEGFSFWVGQMTRLPLRDVGTQRALVCSFITSAEYQLRFGSSVSHSNAECVR